MTFGQRTDLGNLNEYYHHAKFDIYHIYSLPPPSPPTEEKKPCWKFLPYQTITQPARWPACQPNTDHYKTHIFPSSQKWTAHTPWRSCLVCNTPFGLWMLVSTQNKMSMPHAVTTKHGLKQRTLENRFHINWSTQKGCLVQLLIWHWLKHTN